MNWMPSTLISSNLIDFFNIVDSFEIVAFSKFFNVVEVVKIITTNFHSIVFDLIDFFDVVFIVLGIKITI